jgi:glutathione-regulated potassium-efflux system protein KefB
VLYVLGRRAGLEAGPSRRLALAIAQGGEFAFVLFASGVEFGVLDQKLVDVLAVAVMLSMAATPLLLLLDEMLAPKAEVARAFDALPQNDGHVVIAGFGRVGQIVGRILAAKQIPFTALDANPEHVDGMRKFGARTFYGDASRPEILDAAQTDKARAFVLAIDNVEASLRTAQMVKQRYPHVPIYARSRHRRHTHQLMDLGVKIIRRETFLSSLDLTRELLRGLGLSERDVRFAVDTFRDADRRRLYEDYKYYTDIEKMQELAKSHTQELEELFTQDAKEQAAQQQQKKKPGERITS